jgi:hypothetical protein
MKKPTWTEEKIKAGFEKFYAEHDRYPTSGEIDRYASLPSARQLQRMYEGGLPEIRKKLGLKGPHDFTKGAYSSERARTINKRAHIIESEVHTYLIGIFGQTHVHREAFFNDDARTRTDFMINHSKGNFMVDVFYPKDTRNLAGCLNSKLKTYSNISTEVQRYPIVFLMMNSDIGDAAISRLLANKKNKLMANQKVMRLSSFKEYCGGFSRMK